MLEGQVPGFILWGKELGIESADCSCGLLDEGIEQAWGSSERMCISNVKRATGLAVVSRKASTS